jgi:hypothetical protein
MRFMNRHFYTILQELTVINCQIDCRPGGVWSGLIGTQSAAEHVAEPTPMPGPVQVDTGVQDGSQSVPWWLRAFGE